MMQNGEFRMKIGSFKGREEMIQNVGVRNNLMRDGCGWLAAPIMTTIPHLCAARAPTKLKHYHVTYSSTTATNTIPQPQLKSLTSQ